MNIQYTQYPSTSRILKYHYISLHLEINSNVFNLHGFFGKRMLRAGLLRHRGHPDTAKSLQGLAKNPEAPAEA